jgi:hypothetical protein
LPEGEEKGEQEEAGGDDFNEQDAERRMGT